MKINLKQAEFLIKLARKAIYGDLKKDEYKKEIGHFYEEKRGVFVTLYYYPKKELRGCVGIPYPTFILGEAIIKAAKESAFHDPRFGPLDIREELDKIIIEISILTVPKEVIIKNENDLNKIKIGKDGLLISKGYYSGLLLPQVATEFNMQEKEFLEETCRKAGLSREAWKEKDCKIFKFQAQIFSEIEPNGKIKKK